MNFSGSISRELLGSTRSFFYYYLGESDRADAGIEADADLNAVVDLLRDAEGNAGLRLHVSVVTMPTGRGVWFGTDRTEGPALFHQLGQPYAALFTGEHVVNLARLHPKFSALVRFAERCVRDEAASFVEGTIPALAPAPYRQN